MGWGVDEQGEPQGGWLPSTKTQKTGYVQGLRPSWEVVPGEDTRLTPDRMATQGSLCPGQPPSARPHGRGLDLRRPQITLRTVFNICKTATRAAKVNSVPGSSKVSGFKCFPFA